MAQTGMSMKPLVRIGKTPDKCWEWLGNKTEGGYGKKTCDKAHLLAHRWLWQQLFGPIPDGLVINHICQNRGCVNPHHLEAITQAENCRAGAGTRLLPEDVITIRRARKDAGPGVAAALAQKYSVSPQIIRDIWKGRAWKKGKPFYGPINPRNQYSGGQGSMSNKGSPSYIAAHGTRKRSKPIDIKIADQLCDGPDNVPGIAKAIEHKQGEVIEGLLQLIDIGWVERVEGDVMTSYQLGVVKSANPLRRAA